MDDSMRWYAEAGAQQEWEHAQRALAVGPGTRHDTTPTRSTHVKISQMMESKYMKRSDLDEHGGEAVVTIVKIGQGNVARDDEQPDLKWMVRFKEFPKPMVLNSTNIQLIAQATGADDTDDWIGRQVLLYDDPNVSFGGKLVGGLRIKRVRKGAMRTAPAPADTGSAADMDDDVPFADPYKGRRSYVV